MSGSKPPTREHVFHNYKYGWLGVLGRPASGRAPQAQVWPPGQDVSTGETLKDFELANVYGWIDQHRLCAQQSRYFFIDKFSTNRQNTMTDSCGGRRGS